MGWICDEPFRFRCADFADVFEWREAVEGFLSACGIVAIDKVRQVSSEFVAGLIVIAFDRCFFQRPVYPLDLSVRPGMVGCSA